MAKKPLPTPEVLRQLLRYEPETGKLFWKTRPEHMFQSGTRPSADSAIAWNNKFAGKEALYAIGTAGYPQGTVWCKNYRAHRVAWAIYYGRWPDGIIDHVNGDRTDNRITNLRDASLAQNMCNRPAPSDNKSGFKGVYWNSRENKWHVQVSFNGKRKSGGYYRNKEDAVRAYATLAGELHGEFARLT